MALFAPSAGELGQLNLVTGGEAPADVALINARIVHVDAGEIRTGQILIHGTRIAGLLEPESRAAQNAREVIDCHGSYVLPGFIEVHTHLVRLSLEETIALQVHAGVTTTVIDPGDLGYRHGTAAIRYLTHAAADLPGRALFWLPPTIGLDPERDRQLDKEDWTSLLNDPLVVGVGEAYWADLLRGHTRATELIQEAMHRGMRVDGHGAGASPASLAALASLGVDADHEAIDAEQALARLRLGMFALLRHGATRQDLGALAALWLDHDISLDRTVFVTDGVEPDQLASGRSLNSVVAEAVHLGLPAVTAIQLGTLNAARRLGALPWLGSIRPAALADLQVKDELLGQPHTVLVGGRVAPTLPAQRATVPEPLLHSVRIGLREEREFQHPGAGDWRAISASSTAPLVTREKRTDGSDAVVIVSIDLLDESRIFRGLLSGYPVGQGAIATSSVADGNCLLATGGSARDLATAVNRVIEMGGGAAVSRGGQIVASWEAPLAGLLSLALAEQVTKEVAAVNAAMRDLGNLFPNPLLTLEFLTSPAVPHLRICPAGYVRLRDGARLGLDWVSPPQ